MNCDEFRAQYLAGENSEGTAGHLAHCAACRSRQPDIEAGRNALKDPATWEEPPPELQDQVIAPGRRKQEQRRTQTGTGRAMVAPRRRGRGHRHRRRPLWLVSDPFSRLGSGYAGNGTGPSRPSTITGWNTDSGTRLVMTVKGLDPAPAGYVYEFWLSQGPLHISAGTFSAGGEIDLWTGVTRAEFPRLWVTLEPLDDDESPSGHTVLDTEV